MRHNNTRGRRLTSNQKKSKQAVPYEKRVARQLILKYKHMKPKKPLQASEKHSALVYARATLNKKG